MEVRKNAHTPAVLDGGAAVALAVRGAPELVDLGAAGGDRVPLLMPGCVYEGPAAQVTGTAGARVHLPQPCPGVPPAVLHPRWCR